MSSFGITLIQPITYNFYYHYF